MDTVIVLGNISIINLDDLKNKYIIGVEKGAIKLIELGYKPDLAIGDFDSCNSVDIEIIENNAKEFIKLNPIKDLTDTEEAILKAKGNILILGGIKGKRIEHFYANIKLLEKYKNIIMKDEYSKIYIKEESFSLTNEYKYISLFSLTNESLISISGMKYNLDNYILRSDNPTLGISNEYVKDGFVTIKSGKLLVFESKEDHENL